MPQISISVSQDVYEGLRRGVVRHQEANTAAVVRKLVACYARGIIFFRGAFPEIHRGKLDEFELEIFQGELPETVSKISAQVEEHDWGTGPKPADWYEPKEGEPIDWDRLNAQMARVKEKK